MGEWLNDYFHRAGELKNILVQFSSGEFWNRDENSWLQ